MGGIEYLRKGTIAKMTERAEKAEARVAFLEKQFREVIREIREECDSPNLAAAIEQDVFGGSMTEKEAL